MNQIIREAAQQTSHTWIVGVMTVAFLAIFIGTIVWLFSSRNQAALDEAARLPFDNDVEDD